MATGMTTYKGKIICPKEEQYGCMVDLLGRSGRLDEALEFIKGMPVAPSAAIWRSFLNSCRMHANVELDRFAASQLLEVDPEHHLGAVGLLRDLQTTPPYSRGLRLLR